MEVSYAYPTPMSHPRTSSNSSSSSYYKHIWLITGPAGCGKSTVANYIATSLHLPYLEGDDFHSAENVEKMSRGIPLTDADRWDWLVSLRKAAMTALYTPMAPRGVVVTCSALKRKYRDVMRVAPYNDPSIKVHFVFLSASEEVLMERVTRRQDHYMGAGMVKSQLEVLEIPGPEEGDVLSVDVSASKEEVETKALRLVREVMAEDIGRDAVKL